MGREGGPQVLVACYICRMQSKGKQRVSWKRIGLALVALWVVGQIGEDVIYWHGARSAAGDPAAAIVPQTLPDKALADLSSGTAVMLVGTSLRVPWTAVTSRFEKRDFARINFADGHKVTLIAMGGVADALSMGKTEEMESSIRAFGQKAVRSNYEMEKEKLDASPKDVSILNSPTENVRLAILLRLKRIEMGDEKASYVVGSERVHGFQIGDPAERNMVQLMLFDAEDREMWVIVSGPKPGLVGALTQEQLNAIVASIVPPA